jgi:hypothetical protein
MGSSGFGRSRTWLVVALLGAALSIQACSNQTSGSGTPSFPSGTTGHGDGPAGVIVQVAINPNHQDVEGRIGITVLVLNVNGRPLEGKHVQLSTTDLNLDRVDGFTDADGKFVSFLFCARDASAVITAFVEGTAATGTATCGAGTAPTGGTATGTGTGTGGGTTTQAAKRR